MDTAIHNDNASLRKVRRDLSGRFAQSLSFCKLQTGSIPGTQRTKGKGDGMSKTQNLSIVGLVTALIATLAGMTTLLSSGWFAAVVVVVLWTVYALAMMQVARLR